MCLQVAIDEIRRGRQIVCLQREGKRFKANGAAGKEGVCLDLFFLVWSGRENREQERGPDAKHEHYRRAHYRCPDQGKTGGPHTAQCSLTHSTSVT